MSVKDFEDLYAEMMNSEPVPKYKKSSPGKRSETSKANAAKAREAKLAKLREKQMFENFVAQKTKEVLEKKNSLDPRELIDNFQKKASIDDFPKKNPKKYAPKIPMEYEDDDSSESSDEEVIYVAPAPRKTKTQSVKNNDEFENIKKELEELKKTKKLQETDPKIELPPKSNPQQELKFLESSQGSLPIPIPQKKHNDEFAEVLRKKILYY